MARHQFMGLPLDDLSLGDTLKMIDRLIAERKCAQHTVLNVAKVVMAQRDPFLKESIEGSELVQADGQAIYWAARLLGLPIPERIAGIDLMEHLLAHAAERAYTVYFLGATQEVLTAAVKRIRERYPALQVVGMQNGYFAEEQSAEVARKIRDAKPDILFVAMPTPRKENFIKAHFETLQVPFAMGVGGSLDIYAGLVKRAPVWVQKMGGEWFFRMAQEPGRLWKRYLTTNVLFLGMLIKEVMPKAASKKK